MLLTVEQAVERLGTSARFIRRLRTEKRIAVVKLGKHIRLDSADLDAYIEANRQEAADHRRPTAASDDRWSTASRTAKLGREGSR